MVFNFNRTLLVYKTCIYIYSIVLRNFVCNCSRNITRCICVIVSLIGSLGQSTNENTIFDLCVTVYIVTTSVGVTQHLTNYGKIVIIH